jgi:hypothetical protein
MQITNHIMANDEMVLASLGVGRTIIQFQSTHQHSKSSTSTRRMGNRQLEIFLSIIVNTKTKSKVAQTQIKGI